MKTVVFLFVVISRSCLAASPHGALPEGIYEHNNRLIGHPSKVIETKYSNVNFADSHDTVPTRWMSTQITSYDRKGRLHKVRDLDQSGKLLSKEVYHYRLRLSQVNIYNHLSRYSGWKFGQRLSVYDDRHNLLSERTVHFEDAIRRKVLNTNLEIYQYDQDGFCTVMKGYRNDTILIAEAFYKCDHRGNCIWDSINSQGINKHLWKYNDKDMCVEAAKYSSDTLRSTILMGYDTLNQLVNVRNYKPSSELNPYLSSTITLVYDKKGNWLSQTLYQIPVTVLEKRTIYYRSLK